jgi:hypothetical protein
MLALVGAAAAQGIVFSPRAIIVNPAPTFDVQVWLDKDTTGLGSPVYAVGEAIRISVQPSEDAYIYLYSIGADGEVVQILPNRFDAAGANNFVRAGNVRTFPPTDARYTFSVTPPQGLAKVIAVASRSPLNVSSLLSFRASAEFASGRLGEEGFASALSIIINPVPSRDWVSATALYYVGSAPQQGAFGTINVDSQPQRGEVYVDRAFVGYTPLSYSLRPGTYDVEVVAGGRSASQRVTVRPDRTSELFFPLRVTLGGMELRANVGFARVFLNGSEVGVIPAGSGRLTLSDLDPGVHEVVLLAPGYQAWIREVSVRAGETTVVEIRMLRR